MHRPISSRTVHSTSPGALSSLSEVVERELRALGADRRPVVFACIGTDRSTGDALGPLVGQRLERLGHDRGDVVGTLAEPLHALNLAQRIGPRIAERPRPLVVAVDAALGSLDAVGSVSVRPGGLRPGEGVGKDLLQVGELAIAATVNVRAGALDTQVLQCTRLFLVQELSELISGACWWALRSIRRDADAGQGAPARRLEVVA
ncbi:MAG TPA: spore protease YyaC [Miltoncostaeaceae bacterium]|nr:spore protease YyaC [Miltoncostaeaceae bacterium]